LTELNRGAFHNSQYLITMRKFIFGGFFLFLFIFACKKDNSTNDPAEIQIENAKKYFEAKSVDERNDEGFDDIFYAFNLKWQHARVGLKDTQSFVIVPLDFEGNEERFIGDMIFYFHKQTLNKELWFQPSLNKFIDNKHESPDSGVVVVLNEEHRYNQFFLVRNGSAFFADTCHFYSERDSATGTNDRWPTRPVRCPNLDDHDFWDSIGDFFGNVWSGVSSFFGGIGGTGGGSGGSIGGGWSGSFSGGGGFSGSSGSFGFGGGFSGGGGFSSDNWSGVGGWNPQYDAGPGGTTSANDNCLQKRMDGYGCNVNLATDFPDIASDCNTGCSVEGLTGWQLQERFNTCVKGEITAIVGGFYSSYGFNFTLSQLQDLACAGYPTYKNLKTLKGILSEAEMQQLVGATCRSLIKYGCDSETIGAWNTQTSMILNNTDYRRTVLSSFTLPPIVWEIGAEFATEWAIATIIKITGLPAPADVKDAITAAATGDWATFTVEVGKIVAKSLGKSNPLYKIYAAAEGLGDLFAFGNKFKKLLDNIGTAGVTRAWEIIKNIPGKLRFNTDYFKYLDDLKFPKIGRAARLDYAKTFHEAFPEIDPSSIYQVHHAIPRASQYRDNLFDDYEVNSIENLRGIPKDKSWIHGQISGKWTAWYNTKKNPITGKFNYTLQDALNFAKTIDDEFGQHFLPPIR
jgi:hypothetical protein